MEGITRTSPARRLSDAIWKSLAAGAPMDVSSVNFYKVLYCSHPKPPTISPARKSPSRPPRTTRQMFDLDAYLYMDVNDEKNQHEQRMKKCYWTNRLLGTNVPAFEVSMQPLATGADGTASTLSAPAAPLLAAATHHLQYLFLHYELLETLSQGMTHRLSASLVIRLLPAS